MLQLWSCSACMICLWTVSGHCHAAVRSCEVLSHVELLGVGWWLQMSYSTCYHCDLPHAIISVWSSIVNHDSVQILYSTHKGGAVFAAGGFLAMRSTVFAESDFYCWLTCNTATVPVSELSGQVRHGRCSVANLCEKALCAVDQRVYV